MIMHLGKGGEWVEILNTGTSDIDLTGWSIVDNAGNTLPFNASHLVGRHRLSLLESTESCGQLHNNLGCFE
ncbi:MAG: hypothetical protein CM15mP71_2280 [Candidatus Poseidoniales archaeon]|nr:MAG: hypothetical protein CM15mP71_2280 [Candidatus Poseidoniales archaeon]